MYSRARPTHRTPLSTRTTPGYSRALINADGRRSGRRTPTRRKQEVGRQRRLEGPVRKFVQVMRAPAPNITFRVEMWVPEEELTEEEKSEYEERKRCEKGEQERELEMLEQEQRKQEEENAEKMGGGKRKEVDENDQMDSTFGHGILNERTNKKEVQLVSEEQEGGNEILEHEQRKDRDESTEQNGDEKRNDDDGMDATLESDQLDQKTDEQEEQNGSEERKHELETLGQEEPRQEEENVEKSVDVHGENSDDQMNVALDSDLIKEETNEPKKPAINEENAEFGTEGDKEEEEQVDESPSEGGREQKSSGSKKSAQDDPEGGRPTKKARHETEAVPLASSKVAEEGANSLLARSVNLQPDFPMSPADNDVDGQSVQPPTSSVDTKAKNERDLLDQANPPSQT